MDHLGDDLTPVLVTGASGYLGRRVLDLLKKNGLEAVGSARSRDGGLATCDLTDRASVGELMRRLGPVTVIHCAAVVPRSASEYHDAKAGAASLLMVENLVRQKPRRFIYASSMTVYPDHIVTAHEDDAMPAGNGYAAHKLEAEKSLLAQAEMDVAILRLPGLFGPPRRSGVLYNAALAFAKGQDFRLVVPAPRWSALHVDDAAEVMVRAAQQAPQHQYVVNVGYPGRMAVADAVAQLASIFGIHWAPPEPRWFALDLTRLHRTLGPVGCDFGMRLRQVAAWAREAAVEVSDD
jgi:nucleoside-diphosphate-sugar epimerase